MNFKSLNILLTWLIFGLVLSSCGDRTKFETAKHWIPALLPGEGRLFVYQKRNLLTTFSTSTFVLNGKEIADFNSGTSFFIDLKAGEYEIGHSDSKRKYKITVPEGGELYLKYSFSITSTNGRNFRVKQVPADVGAKEIDRTFLIDPKVPLFRIPYIYL